MLLVLDEDGVVEECGESDSHGVGLLLGDEFKQLVISGVVVVRRVRYIPGKGSRRLLHENG